MPSGPARPDDLARRGRRPLHELHYDPQTMRWVRHGRPETRQETEQLLATYLREQDVRGWTKWRLADLRDTS